MAALGAMQPGEIGVEVAAFEERLDGDGDCGRHAGRAGGVVVEDLPDRRGAGLVGADLKVK